MKEIGRVLKEKREQMNVSFVDVRNAIKFQEKYLSAIEKGDMSVFFTKVYYKTFVRSYAKYLGFNPEELIEKYDADERTIDDYKIL